MAREQLPSIALENATLYFRNFSGTAGTYNAAGQRNFCVLLPEDVAEQLQKDGWNIRRLPENDDGTPGAPYTQIKVNFKTAPTKQPPDIQIISSRGKTRLNEDTVHILDWADIDSVDLIINPYEWSVNQNTGRKGYVKSMYVKIHENEFEAKYYDIPQAPDSTVSKIGGCGNCETCDGSGACSHQ